VFPFDRFAGVDVVLGPEMRSTGEVMGIDESYGMAFAKAQMAIGLSLPADGNALVSVNDPDKPRVIPVAGELHQLGFDLFATIGTHRVLAQAGIPSVVVSKHRDESGPFLLDMILDGSLDLLINTPIHTGRASDEGRWRAAAFAKKIPLITTLSGARAAVAAIRAIRQGRWGVRPLQEYLRRGERS
jgi:carbamoyl-phosphate synthase large subunit